MCWGDESDSVIVANRTAFTRRSATSSINNRVKINSGMLNTGTISQEASAKTKQCLMPHYLHHIAINTDTVRIGRRLYIIIWCHINSPRVRPISFDRTQEMGREDGQEHKSRCILQVMILGLLLKGRTLKLNVFSCRTVLQVILNHFIITFQENIQKYIVRG